MSFARPLAAFATGAIACSFWPHDSAGWLSYWPALLGLSVISLLFVPRFWPRSRLWLVLLSAALLGVALFVTAVNRAESKMLSPDCDGQIFNTEFQVEGLPTRQISRGQTQWKLLAKLANESLSNCFIDKNSQIKLSYWALRGSKSNALTWVTET